eukprot:TRINITY_DN16254_c0_g1_i1.p1 TRINITY_DN16254_c0_g1~~TRINITY_DN16254_c0_g1_i1.p1  ORF type:complete len:172 (+),score=48.15 TRINITY_DN16254_c0_g1_i1:12-527(+)
MARMMNNVIYSRQSFFFFQAEDGIRDAQESRGLGDVYKRQVSTQSTGRYRIAKEQTASQAQLGENLLDQRTRDLLSDIESLRSKDPLRLENEANIFHEQFWKRRAKAIANQRNERRSAELTRGLLQGEARGTDMTEWLGAKAKDDQEREVARRTHDYIQGFHQHLKTKRLI